MAHRDEVIGIVTAAVDAMTEELREQIRTLTEQLQNLRPQRVEPYEPVTLARTRGTSLDLIKSLPDFHGDISAYPAWRDAAHFAMSYYVEGTENYYIAMGILRNKITGMANSKLSSFNTVLNFTAIIARLDQCFADKRSLQVLENQLSILRQGKLSITEFYDEVDKHLTLIVNKNKMTYPGNNDVADALNDRARDNALRVFISGLRKPLNEILFSTKPTDLPSALATAQELESDQRRQEFARIFAEGSVAQMSRVNQKSNNTPSSHPSYKRNGQKLNGTHTPQQQPVPMDVDPGSSMFRRPTAVTRQQFQFNGDTTQNPPTKREREIGSGRSAPVQKQQRVNHLNTDPPEEEEVDDSTSEAQYSQYEEEFDEQVVEELHFLE